MNRATVFFHVSGVSLLWAGALAGCQSGGARDASVAAGEDDSDGAAARDALTMPGASARGRFEERGVDSRTTANYFQHSHTSIGRDFDPDISADGELLVYASTSHSERADIFLKAVDGFAVTQITADPADDIQPHFSPKGEQIAFCSNRTGNWDIWIVSRDGTGLTQVTSDRADEIAPCWSPDGAQLAFSQWGARSRQWEIWTIAVDQPGTRRFLCYGMFPAWSPNGQRLAYQRARERGSRWFSIWAVDLVDRNARHPTELAWSPDAACIAPRWSPSGRALAYSSVPLQAASAATAATADVWSVDTHSGVRRKLTDGTLSAFNPVWGRDGRVFFVSAASGVETIWSTAGDGASDLPGGGEVAARHESAATMVNEPNSADDER